MWQVLQLILKNCEIVVRNEGLKFQVSAKGPFAVLAAAVIIIVMLLARK